MKDFWAKCKHRLVGWWRRAASAWKERWHAMTVSFSHDLGIDLGTANTLVYLKNKGILLREPSVVAVDSATGHPRCFGSEAKAVIGRTPEHIVAVRPLKGGVIANFDVATAMLEHFIRKACNGTLLRPRVVICIPSGVTEVERRAVKSAAQRAGTRQVEVVEEPMAAAIGAGLPVEEPTGSMIVDIGGGTTEVAVISLGGIVAGHTIRVGGDAFDAAIITYVKKKYNLLVGERTAEEIKIHLGNAYPREEPSTMEVKGRNLVDGLPKNMMLSSEEIREALSDSLAQIVEAIRQALESTPPELSADIVDNGITLSGGGALLPGLDQLLTGEIGIAVRCAPDPLDCVALGTGILLERPDLLAQLLQSRNRAAV